MISMIKATRFLLSKSICESCTKLYQGHQAGRHYVEMRRSLRRLKVLRLSSYSNALAFH